MTKFQRKSKLKVAAILSADWHIRSDIPICRTDDFFAAMEKKIDFILALSKKHDCPILIAGDIGHKPQWQNWLLEWAIHKFQRHFVITIPGQHDLPNHRLDLFEKSGMGVLMAADVMKAAFVPQAHPPYFNLYPFPYGREIKKHKDPGYPNIAMIHQMVIESKLKKFPEYDLILSGDNHNPFVAEHEGRLLVNPGSLMRTTADQENHKPRIYLWYSEINTVEAVYLPIEKNVISRTHIDIAKNRENRNKAFIQRVADDTEIQLSYENNLENYFNKYRTEKRIVEKTWESVE